MPDRTHRDCQSQLQLTRAFRFPRSFLAAPPGLPGHVSRHWLDSVRAERFEIEAAVGESTEFAHVTMVRDTVADLTFAPGTAVRLRVNARNAAGQSSASPVVTIMVPQAVPDARPAADGRPAF